MVKEIFFVKLTFFISRFFFLDFFKIFWPTMTQNPDFRVYAPITIISTCLKFWKKVHTTNDMTFYSIIHKEFWEEIENSYTTIKYTYGKTFCYYIHSYFVLYVVVFWCLKSQVFQQKDLIMIKIPHFLWIFPHNEAKV